MYVMMSVSQSESVTHLITQTFKRRERIVADNWGGSEIWSQVNKVLRRLDVAGMSSDESDDGYTRVPTVNPRSQKRLRRVRLQWLSPAISDLFAAVETYDKPALRPREVFLRRGNLPLYRDPTAKRTDDKRPPILELPRNWYDDEWYKGLGRLGQLLIRATPEEPIPVLVRVHSTSSKRTRLTIGYPACEVTNLAVKW